MEIKMPAQVQQGNFRAVRYMLLAALVATFLLLVMGNVVRVQNAGGACPDWPTCYGQWAFPADKAAQLQVIHRWLAVLAGVLVAAAAGLSALVIRKGRMVKGSIFLALGVVLLQVGFGAFVARWGSGSPLTPIHLGLALAALGLAATATTAAFILGDGAQAQRPLLGTRFARLTLWTMAGIGVLMLGGAVLSNTNAGTACSGWPLCAGGLPESGAGWLALSHRIVTGLVSVLIVLQFFRAWRSQRSRPVELVAATSVFTLFVGQVLLGALKVSRGFPADLVGLHAASAAALWAVQVVLVTATSLAGRTDDEERQEAAAPLHFRSRLQDFVMLSKPLIVALLLVTTYAGMVVGGHRIPGLAVTLWTLLGGALAAGGSSALNQYIDRDIDASMQRTAKRPLPAKRLLPAEGLAYGTAACLSAFILLAGFVNLLAAVLSLAGMIYYVLIYSMWLKRLTVQNIVIGGGAGAIPPLVGWAAATGSLNIPSLMLFAIIFLWTPPHFWALALVRRNDYARASVPMLPVIRGEEVTQVQIFVYTLELVTLTLLLPLFKITGSVYLISAIVLGGYLIYSAWQVLRKGGNKNAFHMYRTSSMYLMLLFLALVIDVLI